MTSARIRTARGLLNWNVQELGKRAGRSANERGITGGRPETLKAIQKALEKVGVEFTNGKGHGVNLLGALRKRQPTKPNEGAPP